MRLTDNSCEPYLNAYSRQVFASAKMLQDCWLEGHTGGVNAVAVLPGGDIISAS